MPTKSNNTGGRGGTRPGAGRKKTSIKEKIDKGNPGGRRLDILDIRHIAGPAVKKRRVAGYARVSTDKDEQFTSYEAQVDYYTQFIKRHPDWEFVKVYTDEGISGLGTKKREGFNEMIESSEKLMT